MSEKKILICDDDLGILEVMQMMLEMEGFTILTESNSTNLINDIRTFQPDLLLMDLWMPVLSGDQLLKTIRSTKDIEALPVIILSASVDGNDIAHKAGADNFISKPFELDHLANVVKEVLKESQNK